MASVKWPVDFPGLEFQQLDRVLRCGICYEYFNTALMTGCSHNYCSLCIRKSIGYRTECPTCMTETFESHLRSNRILDDIVTLFRGIKSTLLPELLHKHSSLQLREEPCTAEHGADDNITNTKRQVKSVPSDHETTIIYEEKRHYELFNREIVSNPNVKEISDSDLRNVVTPKKNLFPPQLAVGGPSTSKTSIKIPAMFSSPKKSVQNTEAALKKVTCPVCNVDIPEKNINFHLDNCLKRGEEQVKIRDQQRETRRPLKKPVFSLLKQSDLKKKLKDHGLNNTGSRETLIKRFERFILLYNTECDSLKPRPVADIIRQVEQEEQEEKKIPAQQKILTFPKNDNEKSDDIRREYLKKNKASFEDLIQKAKQQLQQKKQPLPECSTSTVKVVEDGDLDNFSNRVKKVESSQNNLPSDDTESSSNSDIVNEVGIKNNSSKKCFRKLQYTDDEDDTEEDVQVSCNLPSVIGQMSSKTDQTDKNMCVVGNDNVPVSGTSSSSAVKTPPKYMRNSDATDSGNDSNTPNVQVSPVFAARSSVKRFKSDYSEVQASPEMFVEEIKESCSLRNGDVSDAESDKSISLLEYDEGGTSFAGLMEERCQHEPAVNNLHAQDLPSEEVDSGGSLLQESSEEYISYIRQRRSKRRNLCVTEQENVDRVLRKRSKR